jgi:uncharacterized protein (TIGR00661 family)
VKILYAIQGTGNGHLARAEDVVPVLYQFGEVDLFVSGAQADIQLPYPVKYRSKGLSFYFGKKGGVDVVKTFKKNSSKQFYKEIQSFPVEKYDLVVNDFEPISAWACQRKEVRCIALSHQASLLSPRVPKADSYDIMGDWILHHYAPAHHHVGFHFDRYDQNIYTPVIRKSIREAKVEKKDHYTVYLPAYDDLKLVPILTKFPFIRWHVFSKHTRKAYHIGKLSVFPINAEDFVASMSSAAGVLCGAGFETPAEALYMKKKLLVVPMKRQYEQHLNAAALKLLGIPVLKKVSKKYLAEIEDWICSDRVVDVNYSDSTLKAVEHALRFSPVTV